MKTRIFVLGSVALSSIIGAASLVSAQVQSNSSQSFTDGDYQFYARQKQSNGLLRDVTVNKATSPKPSEPTTIIYAKFARKDPKNSKRWVFGNVVVHQFKNDRTHKSQMTAERLIIDVDK